MVSRLIGFPLLLAAAACTTVSTAPTRATLAPQNGPKAHVYASYFGGMTSRTVRSSFRTDKNAHVIVARLGGDGRVTVLYPETPAASTLVRGGKTYSARSFGTSYDGVPQMYQYASRAPRSYGARVDSYDGRGNGFVFIIATQYPMFTEVLNDHGQWSDSLEVEDYYSSYDPRESIRDLAEELTRGMPYSLDYADSFNSSAYTSYADVQYDCATLGGRGFGDDMMSAGPFGGWMPAYGWWFGSGFDSFAWYFLRPPAFYTNGYSSLSACGHRYAYGNPWNNWGWAMGWGPRGMVPIPNIPGQTAPTPQPTTTLGFSPTSRRPGIRNGDESGSAINLMRPRFDGQKAKTTTSTSTSTWAPPNRGTRVTEDRYDRYSRANSSGGGSSGGSSSGAFGSSRTEGLGSSRTFTPAATQASTPAPAQPAPSPKVEAAGAGKPRDP